MEGRVEGDVEGGRGVTSIYFTHIKQFLKEK
jgi:hypothetical protein